MRSKMLLVSNLLSTVYSVVMICIFGGAFVEAGGLEYIELMESLSELAYEFAGDSAGVVTFINAILILLGVHIALFALGTLIGWISYIAKKSGGAKLAATMYLLGTICFPIYVVFGLPITICGYIGGGKQKKINKSMVAAQ